MAVDSQPSSVLSVSLAEQLCQLVQERTGLLFGTDKHQEICKKMAATMAHTPCQSLAEYLVYLRGQPANSATWERCIRELTVGETYFFRNKGHFDALREQILPELIAQRRTSRYLRIWSAGCSTGEEPYSLAILLHELLPDIKQWSITILATDINRDSLAVAQQARYRSWSFRGVDSGTIARHFDEQDGWFTLHQDIRSLVKFGYLNLADDVYPSLTNNTYGLDIILCRNVTIYFSAEVTRQVIKRFYAALVNEGWFFPGSSEPNLVNYQDFTPRNFPGAVVYSKRERLVPQAPAPKPVLEPAPLPPPPGAANLSAPAAPRSAPAVAEPAKSHRQAPQRSAAEHISEMNYRDALAHRQRGRIDDAIALLEANIERCPKHVESYHALARIYADRGQLEQAARLCEQAIARDRRRYEPYFVLSMIHQGQGRIAEAVDALRMVVLFSPRCVLGHYSLATLLAQQGDRSATQQALEQTRSLLRELPQDTLLPEGDGMLAGKLLEIVERMLVTA